jgi:hypothetical protein
MANDGWRTGLLALAAALASGVAQQWRAKRQRRPAAHCHGLGSSVNQGA